MLCVVPDQNGYLSGVVDAIENCSGYVMLDTAEYSIYQSMVEITPADILYVFSWGFGVVLFFWFLGACIGAGKKGVNKV